MNESANSRYQRPAKEIAVLCTYDVVVCGGGPAGCAAAIAARSQGARVLLLEKGGYLGGAAVSQLVCVTLSTNGLDFPAPWHAFMGELQRLGGVNEMVHGDQRAYWFMTAYSPEMAKAAWDNLIEASGADVLFHSYVSDAIVENGVIKGVVCQTRAGERAILAQRVVDCSGDALVSAQAGAGWDMGVDGNPYPQACTKMYRLGNARKAQSWQDPAMLEKIERDLPSAVASGRYDAPHFSSGFVLSYIKGGGGKDLPNGQLLLNNVRLIRVNPLDPFDISHNERLGRRYARQMAQFYQEYVPGCEDSFFLDTSAELGVRASRRVHGMAAATIDDVMHLSKYPDSIARASWEVDIHPSRDLTAKSIWQTEAYAAWIERVTAGDYYDIRYGCVVARDVDNLLMAGRCISAEHEAQGSLRIQQTCMATGQAAGAAAALSLKHGVTPRQLDPMLVVAHVAAERAAAPVAFDILKDVPNVSHNR